MEDLNTNKLLEELARQLRISNRLQAIEIQTIANGITANRISDNTATNIFKILKDTMDIANTI